MAKFDEVSTCPVARSLDVIGDSWSLLIVRDAFEGIRRFGEFQSKLGVSRSVLTQRLRALVDNGILLSRPAADGTAYREYQLTAKGIDLFHVIVALGQWGENHLFAPKEKHSRWLDRKKKQPVRKLQLRSADGRLLGVKDVVGQKADGTVVDEEL
ncbi:winged helix-turn-helix transcriptional regulator [Paraburkholderia rhizosphaerae]|uniref:HxlR family transcriptional regulator n=1 Tax=Paraburkholderia rhizosphaerae TaxID=480658 RepID=A0A4R8L3D6_9BURK|nr:helix-turn-helix domain-containing protein [Paraburkholderia rhizosphaerae]TDY37056.1 HxlR family transcriptional regulator [Paraburkholderia rhizosphaerae]